MATPAGARLRLLLDEHYSAATAQALRRLGHDAVVVVERPELTGLSDRALLAAATAERRMLVTNNVRDFVPLGREFVAAGDDLCGLVFTDDRRLPRSREGIGALVAALDHLLRAHLHEGALAAGSVWID